MPLRYPPRLSLARTPTPLERLHRMSEELACELWAKRDDLTGVALSGNKIRKLEFLAADAREKGADTLITCGGVNSNHARATAVAAARLGLRSHLLLRGQDRNPPEGNLLLDRVVGADVTFISEKEWPNRDEIMAGIADDLNGGRGYTIPEGGSNHIGSMGYARMVQELLGQESVLGLQIRRVVHATGSGGTTAGLALGFAAAGRDEVDVLGIAVCNDGPYFDERVHRILDDAEKAGFADAQTPARARWQIVEGFKGAGYALTTEADMKRYADLAKNEGLLVDPVYTGKAFLGLAQLAADGAFASGGATVYVHTGGIFELFAFADEVGGLSDTSD